MASKYRKKFTLPDGCYQILEDYAREVLRDQPKDIYEFSYLYFKALDEVRITLFLFLYDNFIEWNLKWSLCVIDNYFYRVLLKSSIIQRKVRAFHHLSFNLMRDSNINNKISNKKKSNKKSMGKKEIVKDNTKMIKMKINRTMVTKTENNKITEMKTESLKDS